ncbi:MAG: hypothetical protein IJ518_05455 [Clostridia bacterium]|nr:hypothetical protein [Clostridia bacterium]
MKKRLSVWLAGVAVPVLLAVWVMSGKAVSVGRFISGDNGTCFVVLDNRPVQVHHIGAAGCTVGDKVLVMHQNVFAESWPEQTKGYCILRLSEGTQADIPEDVWTVLRAAGYTE